MLIPKVLHLEFEFSGLDCQGNRNDFPWSVEAVGVSPLTTDIDTTFWAALNRVIVMSMARQLAPRFCPYCGARIDARSASSYRSHDGDVWEYNCGNCGLGAEIDIGDPDYDLERINVDKAIAFMLRAGDGNDAKPSPGENEKSPRSKT